jgi:mono/diheme cytochrome c family protein
MSSARALAGLLALIAASSFHSGPQWPDDMITSPAARALSAPPAGALTIDAETPLSRDDAGERLHNPLPASPATLARGKQLYEIYCLLCHGATGDADGKVGAKFGMPIPSLRDPAVVERKDGFLYGTIREGGFIMPKYAESLTPEERWAVVRYVRSLQQP